MKISPSLAVCRRSLRAVLSRVIDDNIETHSQKLPQDLIRPTLFVLWFGVTRSEVKRAFFATLLYIYLLDPLQFIRGGPLFDDVRLLPLSDVGHLPSDYLPIRADYDATEIPGMGLEWKERWGVECVRECFFSVPCDHPSAKGDSCVCKEMEFWGY